MNPDFQALVNMAVSRLNLISEAVAGADKPVTPKAMKHGRELKSLVNLILQELADIREVQKVPVPKKKYGHVD